MKVFITKTFKRSASKLHRNQVIILEKNIEKISASPDIGEAKVGDLAGVRVYKFHMLHQLILLTYIYNELQKEITLLDFASHENFYKNLKKQLKN
ncbi:MAG: hypothetical protein ACD_69C00229G0003 [uncultured bacterium]|nr:MAG: hypothetical protein ACD_69C00229G0003 [uncultured bacterium]OGT09728.1 MAG: addiction module toxin RelE [Gammaproteobacteria bacterium RBG_16_37_9]HBC71761.1 addiction module toxin RelE [Coxiellaceae bacterium]HBS51443.1 addiction module toxin RelE [Coxiellaceae bacterium]HBY55486.1 addiction module toxin RelE [Coxiellaceae bacterium]